MSHWAFTEKWVTPHLTISNLHWLCGGKWRGKQSHRDYFAGSRNFILIAHSGEIRSQSPDPRSESGDEFYTAHMVYVTRGVCSRWFTGGQEDKSVTEKQVGCRVFPQPPYRMWSPSQETFQSLADGLWHFSACRKLLVVPRIGNSRQILDTQ
jgi:hypothetical protein